LIILTNFSGCPFPVLVLDTLHQIALVCSRFKVTFLANASDEKITTGESIISSISRATKYFEDAGTGPKELELFWYNGARYGRVDVMEWANRQGHAWVWTNKRLRWSNVDKQVCIRAA
jgi:hypothetical protein